MAAVAADVRVLRGWLSDHFPGDVLMPVRPGTKRPAFAHRDGSWDWFRFDAAWSTGAFTDVGVLLRGLCIIDVDSHDLAEELEARFPVLNAAPAERTQRGVHYWFARPPAADAGGYYDGAGQRQHGVDFKTVCRTGTAGFVVVAPSAGRTWIRAPWCLPPGGPPELTQDLLDAVARPTHDAYPGGSSMWTLSWDEGAGTDTGMTLTVNPADLGPVAYFQAFLDQPDTLAPCADDDGVTRVPVPFPPYPFSLSLSPPPEWVQALFARGWDRRALLSALLGLIAARGGELPPGAPPPTPDALHQLSRLGDMLGAPRWALDALAHGSPRAQMDLYALCPAWWDASEADRKSVARDVPRLINLADVRVNDALRYHRADLVVDRTAPASDCWLLPTLLRTAASSALQIGDFVVHANPARRARTEVLDACPGLDGAMRAHPRRLVVAGGAVLGAVCRACPPGADVDVFVCADNPDDASHILQDVHARLQAAWGGPEQCRTVRTTRTVTMFLGPLLLHAPAGAAAPVSDSSHQRMLQVVLRRYDRPEHVPLSFDLPPSQVAMWYDDPAADDPCVMATHSWCESVRRMAFAVDPHRVWSVATTPRLLKYHHKGFDVAVLGTRRAAFRKLAPGTQSRGDNGLRGLFGAEVDILRSRGLLPASTPRRVPAPPQPRVHVHGAGLRRWLPLPRCFYSSSSAPAHPAPSSPPTLDRVTPAEVRACARRLWRTGVLRDQDGYDDRVLTLSGALTAFLRAAWMYLARTRSSNDKSIEKILAPASPFRVQLFTAGGAQTWEPATVDDRTGRIRVGGAFKPMGARMHELYNMQTWPAYLATGQCVDDA